MINFSAFEAIHQKYKKHDIHFLSELRELASKKKIYQGLKILHHVPITIGTVFKIEVLLIGGADVTVSCMSTVPPTQDALAVLKAAHVDLQIEHRSPSEYDFHLDCCGELMDAIPPRIGAVELTQTGTELYKKSNLSYPILSVDDSDLKLLETFFGTGDGFVRALHSKVRKEFYDKKFVIFGYGKVGKGIVHALLKFTDDIVIIDVNMDIKRLALRKGIKYIHFSENEKIKNELKNAAFVVTATGVKNLLSDHNFKKADFAQAILANMGAYDEYGENFTARDVLFEKRPLNFSIYEPTAMKYLDPIFYAHNYAIDLILSGKFKAGYNAFPNDIARNIIAKWAKIHKEDIDGIKEHFV